MTIQSSEADGGGAMAKSSGIKVIVVGLGMAGLSAAIECHLQGHTVIGLEKAPQPTHPGDIFSIGRNGARVIQQWDNGSVARELDAVRCDIDSITVYDETGTVKEKKEMDGFRLGEGWVINRSDTVGALHRYAQRLTIDLRFGITVKDYWEEESQAGVMIESHEGHERLAADCVIASDGIHSKARAVVLGGHEKTHLRKTGSAIFRCGFPASLLQDCPEAQWLLEGTETHDQLNHFIGKDITVLMGTGRHGKDVYWGCMHKSLHDVSEPWLQVSDASKALEYIQHWPCKAKLEAIIQKTPHGKCFDHLVLAADPLPRWTSLQGRTILIGDAAHPFLPTTGQGANQALEDAAVVAICLKLAGKSRIPLGLLVTEKLRHQRVSLIQDGGLKLLQTLHKADWNAESKEEIPTMVARPTWIFAHDCRASTYEDFDTAANAILTGKEFIPTNIPYDGLFRIVDEESRGSKLSNDKLMKVPLTDNVEVRLETKCRSVNS